MHILATAEGASPILTCSLALVIQIDGHTIVGVVSVEHLAAAAVCAE